MTKLSVNKQAIKYNLAQIKKQVGNTPIMPVVKANAYGVGVQNLAWLVDEYPFVGVADVSEAIELLNYCQKPNPKKIFILYQPDMHDVSQISKHGFTIAVNEVGFLTELDKVAKEAIDIHLSIDTGLGSIGIACDEVTVFCKKVKALENINVKGAFSQLAAHESLKPSDIQFTDNQVKKFNDAVSKIEAEFGRLEYKHICCSGAVITRPKDYMDMVRVGCLLYGVYPQEFFKSHIDIKPVISMTSNIISIKELEKGRVVGYHHARAFATDKKSKIATVSIGYANGLTRKIVGSGHFLVDGKKAPIVSISMNLCNIDVTGIKASIGDKVTIFDNKTITLEDMAGWCDIGFDELMTHLNATIVID